MRKLDNINEVNRLFDVLFPICRSIAGEGFRESLGFLSEYVPFETVSFKTGEKILNWTVPQEWHIRDAYVQDASGRKIVDFKKSNLHVLSYSDAVDKKVTLNELKEHTFVCERLPHAIPYVTSYYDKKWGFCVSKNQRESWGEGIYHIYIDSEHIDGRLDLGHAIIPGNSKKEVLISSYLCHPSMANNELSGPIVLAILYQRILKWEKRNLTYRFVINPETIGSIAYLSRYGTELKGNLYGGVVLTCLGKGNNPHFDLSYKMSRDEHSEINKLVEHFKDTKGRVEIRVFSPTGGSDERQYNSPGFNLPVGQFASLVYGMYPEYHTSEDTKELMDINALMENAERLNEIFIALDIDGYYVNRFPYGEVKLSDYGLYSTTSHADDYKEVSNNCLRDGRELLNAILVILNYSDGKHTLLDIANILNINVLELREAVEILLSKGLIEGPYYEEKECGVS